MRSYFKSRKEVILNKFKSVFPAPYYRVEITDTYVQDEPSVKIQVNVSGFFNDSAKPTTRGVVQYIMLNDFSHVSDINSFANEIVSEFKYRMEEVCEV